MKIYKQIYKIHRGGAKRPHPAEGGVVDFVYVFVDFLCGFPDFWDLGGYPDVCIYHIEISQEEMTLFLVRAKYIFLGQPHVFQLQESHVDV